MEEGISDPSLSPGWERFSFPMVFSEESKGDSTCHWVVRKKGESAKEKPMETKTSDDPAKILAIRYAKGEITKEEYEEKMAIIKKHYI
jgi:hypothetical protein